MTVLAILGERRLGQVIAIGLVVLIALGILMWARWERRRSQ
jgi:hypothetical protein